MSQLIQMRQRIRAIETIKKITHAMQLISMSLHTRLRKQAVSRDAYQYNLLNMLQITGFHEDQSTNQHAESTIISNKQLLIIIGAQKGLCGNFDTELLRFIDHDLALNLISTSININTNLISYDIICVGSKKIAQELRKRNLNLIQEFSNLKISSLAQISLKIFNFISLNQHNYQAINSYSNQSETFFLNQPIKTQIYPIATKQNKTKKTAAAIITPETALIDHSDEYLWAVAPQELYHYLLNRYLSYIVQSILFESLLAEQAARFRSMDAANRNASDLLEASYRDYNKLRQYKITKELIELSAAF